MKKTLDQRGTINALLIPLIMSTILLLAAIGFGGWAFVSRQSYKNDSDQKAEAAVAVAVEQTKSEKDNEFLEKEKEPLKDYASAAQFGSFTFKYPKTWSAYVNEQDDTLSLLAHPDVVKAGEKTANGLKVEVLNSSYKQSVTTLDGLIRQGKLQATAYSLPKVPSVTGLRVDGQITNDKTGAAVYLPLRDKTIKISSETQERLGDFNNIILKNFQFNP